MNFNSENLPQLYQAAAVDSSIQRSTSEGSQTANDESSFNLEPETIFVGGRQRNNWSAEAHASSANSVMSDRPTELANADFFNQTYGDHFRWNSTRRKWLVWRRTHWAHDSTGHAERCAKRVVRSAGLRMLGLGLDNCSAEKFAKQSETAKSIGAILTLARSEPGRSINEIQLDADPYLLNVANGTLNLNSGSVGTPLQRHDRHRYQRTCLSTPYHPDAAAPQWETFLNQIMNGDTAMIDYLQRLAGSCLTGESRRQELYIAYGPGANGKSLYFDTLLSILGGYGCMAPESLLTSRGKSDHPTSVARLVGKRMVVASETEADANLRVQQMKRLTGDSMIAARFMRQDYFEFPRTFKLFMITNNRPRIPENTDAVWRRLRLIPFNVVIPESARDPHLSEKFKTESAGILCWMVEGWRKFQADGLQVPAKVQAATIEYRKHADEVPEFVDEYCQRGDSATHWVSRQKLYDGYLAFAESPNEPGVLSRAAFYSRLVQIPGIEPKDKKISRQKKRGFSGISY